jgi:hypothetical protein
MTGELSHRPGMMCQFLNSPLKPLEMLPLLQKRSTDIKIKILQGKNQVTRLAKQKHQHRWTHPIPPRGTPCEADGLQRSFVNGSMGAFCKHNSRVQFISSQPFDPRCLKQTCARVRDVTLPCEASSRTYDHSLRPRLI